MFKIEYGFDFLIINGEYYTGRDRINIVISAQLFIHFESDEIWSDTGFGV